MRPVIVVALGPDAARPLAWDEACARARGRGADLVAIRPGGERASTASELLQAWDDLQWRAREAGCPGTLDLVVARGDITGEIARAAARASADLVVVGASTWPADELAHRARYVIEKARCPVLIVRPTTPSGVVIGGIDGDCAGSVAAAVADELARWHQSFAFLVRCAAPGAPPASRALPQELVGRHRLRGVGLTIEADAGPGLVEIASDLRAAMIVVGASRSAAVGSARLGGVAAHVIHFAECAVLVVPPPTNVRCLPRARTTRPQA